MTELPPSSVAIVGMAGRFPGAPDVATFWRNLLGGVESIAVLTDAMLDEAGVPEETRRRADFVPAAGMLGDVAGFDAGFFGFTPREARLLDPQHRLFLECAWEALEDAGIDPARARGPVGLFAGASLSAYLARLLQHRPDVVAEVGTHALTLANDKDFLCTRVAYKLDLRGPCVSVQTACSTSLVATHLAVLSLLAGECDVALAGGVSVAVPQGEGHTWREGDILSRDGHCRAFGADASGTVRGSGAGVVVLKRLEDAVADGDAIVAVIRGTAANNDGGTKAGFTAPSAEGQAAVIRQAQMVAQIDPSTVGFVEGHGTGTGLGDPIEVRGLTDAFRQGTEASGCCALGSVKSNVGHLDAAAGVTGLIKAALAVRSGRIPPTLHATTPNPALALSSTPFFLPSTGVDWPDRGGPRRAGVSSFGVGGTNAHVVLEEAPTLPPADAGRPWQVLPVSARTPAAVERAAAALTAHVDANPLPPADVAWTLQTGRRAFAHRQAFVCGEGRLTRVAEGTAADRTVAYLFPGQGAQRLRMGRHAFETEPVFRAALDRCAAIAQPHLGVDLRAALYPRAGEEAVAERDLHQTWMTQPALFAVEYALATLLASWGIRPVAMLGHSIGEWVAACLAGVFTLEDALALVCLRGRLVQELGPGAMCAVWLPEASLAPLLGGLDVAAVNAPGLTVVSGRPDRVEELQARLREDGVDTLRLHTHHAFHSRILEPALERFAEAVARVALNAPTIPFASNVTGTWIRVEEATYPRYWALQLRAPVRFDAGLSTLLQRASVLLEVGPGRTLTGLAARHAAFPSGGVAVPTLPRARDGADAEGDDPSALAAAVGAAWCAGIEVDWGALHAGESRRRVSLPTYPFERERHWIDGTPSVHGAAPVDEASPAPEPIAQAPEPDDVPGVIRRIALSLLGVENLADDESFFARGGESLLAIQLVSRVRERFGVELPLHAFFASPTVAGLAALVAEGKATADAELEALLAEIEGLDPEAVAAELAAATPEPAPEPTRRDAPTDLQLSILFFSGDEATFPDDKYQLVLDGARWADAHGFHAVWTPERHLHRFGGLYPNPAVLGAALAMVTKRLRIRAGSVVLPLHHPLRVAEEWSVVDNLSGGRVDLSVAAGFHPDDFLYAPDRYRDRHDIARRQLDQVRALWRGEAIGVENGAGRTIAASLFPRPKQRDVPIWMTTGERPEGFERAGAAGHNVLTALLLLTPAELAERIHVYREARRANGHDPDAGVVTLMLHTYVGEGATDAEVKEEARPAFYAYLRAHFELVRSQARSEGRDADRLAESDLAAVFGRAYDGYYDGRALMGTPRKCADVLAELRAMGVGEVAALVDFGLSRAQVFGSLERLAELAGLPTAAAEG